MAERQAEVLRREQADAKTVEYVRRPERLGLGAEPATLGAKKPKKYIKVRPACKAQTPLLWHRPRRKRVVCVRYGDTGRSFCNTSVDPSQEAMSSGHDEFGKC